jgi:hypothetical protein
VGSQRLPTVCNIHKEVLRYVQYFLHRRARHGACLMDAKGETVEGGRTFLRLVKGVSLGLGGVGIAVLVLLQVDILDYLQKFVTANVSKQLRRCRIVSFRNLQGWTAPAGAWREVPLDGISKPLRDSEHGMPF